MKSMQKNKCYCCQKEDVERHEICENCGWQNDMLQNEDPTYSGGANDLCLNDYKEQYLNKK